jgi:CubicO group peptidase (beta-lactamase class C family)
MDAETRALREEWARTMFDHDRERHVRQHRDLHHVLDTTIVRTGDTPRLLESRPQELPARFRLPDIQATYLSVAPLAISPGQFWNLIGTEGLLVWHDGSTAHEWYREGRSEDDIWMTNSASKVVVAMLVARAIEDGFLSRQTQLVDLWPELLGSGWDGVNVGHCLTMTTGVDFVEESLDLELDSSYIPVINEIFFGSLERFVQSLGRRWEPGSQVAYSSLDTEALGSALMRATGKGIAAYLEEVLWRPAGMEHEARWLTDTTGREVALSGLCASLRDYARLGLVLLDRGRVGDQQLIPAEFAKGLEDPPAELFDAPGADDYPLLVLDQAFIPSARGQQEGDYMAAGSFNQLIYVHPGTRTVIAHQGVGRDITMEYVDMYRAFMAFRQIGHHLSNT